MDAWLLWLIAAVVLAAAESLSLDLVLVMLAGGAASGAVVAAAGLPPVGQVVVAVAVAAALLVGVRPIAKRHLTRATPAQFGAQALVGKQAVVLSAVDPDTETGRVRLNGAEWSARALSPGPQIPVGTKVQVMAIDGATAVVWSIDPL